MQKSEFLKNFIEMRKSLAPSPMARAAVTAEPTSKKAKRTTKHQVFTDSGLQRIIEEKSPKKEVEDYFQKMCDELTATKMA